MNRYKILAPTRMLVRKPAQIALEYLKRAETSTPKVRMLFYGDPGCGKSYTLDHLTQYLHQTQQFFILNFGSMRRFVRSPRAFEGSITRPGRINSPVDAAILLQRFKDSNALLIEKHGQDLVCTSTYEWSPREKTEAGQPLISVADHGLERMNHASDCLAVLFKELTLAADAGKIRLATVMDNIRFLFHERAGTIRHKDMKYIMVDEMTIIRAVKKLIKGDQRGCFVLAACDDDDSTKQNQTPSEILGYEGWKFFDPCLPIHVPKYTREEFEACMDYYQEVGWFARPEARTQEARDEIRFLSGLNPAEVTKLCAPL